MSHSSWRATVAVLAAIVLLGAALAWRAGALDRTIALVRARVSGAAPGSASTGAPHAGSTPGASTPGADNAGAGTPVPALLTTQETPLPGDVPGYDLARDEAGATIEDISGSYGPGPEGRRLMDGDPATWWSSRDFDLTLPLDIVYSFYKRQPALVAAVTITMPAPNNLVALDAYRHLPPTLADGPKDVEVWTSMTNAHDDFVRAAGGTLAPEPKVQSIAFPPVEARYVRLRITSLQRQAKDSLLALGGIGIVEAGKSGYQPIVARNPDVAGWKGSPRYAAQRGIEWLQPAVVKWQLLWKCFGCHIQAQAVMGLSVAARNEYAVSVPTMKLLADFTSSQQQANGAYIREPDEPSTQFAAMGMAYWDDLQKVKRNDTLLKTVDYLLTRQKPTGEIPNGDERCGPTVVSGPVMATANSLLAFRQAFAETEDARYKDAGDRALAWLTAAQANTTQDKAFKILALTRFAGPPAKDAVQSLVEQLIVEQQTSGGWLECQGDGSSTQAGPFSTGQALYAFKKAGVSISSSPFIKGVKFLLAAQHEDGSWHAEFNQMHTQGGAYAPTMWAIIGLAGSFGTVKTGGLQVTTGMPPAQAAARRNIEIILDASGSMKLPLGKSTRIATARQVLQDVLAKIPDDFNVGLRVYARRYSSRQKETCTDTELLRPIQKLDRQQLLSAVKQVVPRGETPLVYAILQAPADLKAVGGGSVIVVTDGEETCGGDPVTAAQQLKDVGIPITLNIVGFTLTGKKVEQQLTQLAEATGGHYYGAQNGEALTRALTRAALSRFPYVVYDASGAAVAKGLAGPLQEALPPGAYKVVVQAGDQQVTANVVVTAGVDVILELVDRGDHFELTAKPPAPKTQP